MVDTAYLYGKSVSQVYLASDAMRVHYALLGNVLLHGNSMDDSRSGQNWQSQKASAPYAKSHQLAAEVRGSSESGQGPFV